MAGVGALNPAVGTPSCPRCGYDQSGVVASWRDSCPLEGVCSECGLGMAWRDILNPGLNLPRWSFEHGVRLSLKLWGATYARALRPARFWRRLRLEHPVRSFRLLVSVALIVLAMHMIVSGATVWRAYRAAGVMMRTATPGWTMGQGGALVRRPPFPPVTPWRVLTEYRRQLARLAVFPYFRSRIWAMTGPWVGNTVRFERVPGLWLVFLGTAVISVPPGFLVLGQTFRRCRVRFVHLIRGVAYSLAGPLAAVVGSVLVMEVWRGAGAFFAVAAVVWLGVYWPRFVTRYLRLTHGRWVALAMLAIGGLSTGIVTLLVWSYSVRGVL